MQTIQLNNLKFAQEKIKYCSYLFRFKRAGSNVFQLHFIINLIHNWWYLYKPWNKTEFIFLISALILKSLCIKKFSLCFEYFTLISLPSYNLFMPLILQGFFRFVSDKKVVTHKLDLEKHRIAMKTAHPSSLHFDSRDSNERCCFHTTHPAHLKRFVPSLRPLKLID